MAALATVAVGGVTYDFKAWSGDGGARVQSLVGTSSRTLTAAYDGPKLESEPEPEAPGPIGPPPTPALGA